MSINGVQSTSWFLPLNQSNLSEETKRKLRELGIDPSTVSSEAEAQKNNFSYPKKTRSTANR